MDGMIATTKMIDNLKDGTTLVQIAQRANQDGNGDNIVDTYVTKTTPLRGILYANSGMRLSNVIGDFVSYYRSEIMPADYDIKVGDIFTDKVGRVGVVINVGSTIEIETVSNISVDGDGNNIAKTYAKQNGSYPNLTAGVATKATQDGDGNIIASTYAKAIGSYPMLTAGVATLATKATQDGNGNNIFNTYAQKSELRYMHYITVDLADTFHVVCSIRNKSSAAITSKSALLSALLNIGTGKGISATGFLLHSSYGGAIYEIAAVSSTTLRIKTLSTPTTGTVNTYTYDTSSSSIGVQDSVPTL